MADIDTERRRLQWQCRRGMLELDVLLERFLTDRYLFLPTQEQQMFQRLLACSDQDLWRWLVAGETCENSELQRMVEAVLSQQ